MKQLIEALQQTEHGFRHIEAAGKVLLADEKVDPLEMATALLAEESYQPRMLATYLLGQLSVNDRKAMDLLYTRVAGDDNWRVQEMLAKAIDHYGKTIGYEESLGLLQQWLSGNHANRKRAVIEGLRVWTARPYFKEHPETAIRMIAAHKADASEYLRRSVGNALRDIRKKHPALVDRELEQWDSHDPKVAFTQKLVIR